MRHLPRACAAGLLLVSAPAAAAALCDDLGLAGLPASCNRGEPRPDRTPGPRIVEERA